MRRSRVHSRALASIVLSLFALAVGWSALWLFGRHEADRSFSAWIDTERAAGRNWTCPDRSIGGYPLAIVLRCEAPTFEDAANLSFKGRLAAVRATAYLYLPTSVAVDLTGPLTIADTSVVEGLTVNWASAELTLRGDLPGVLDRGHLDAERVEISGAGRAPTIVGTASVGFQPVTSTQTSLSVDLHDVHDLGADAVFGSAEPISATLKATIGEMPQRGASLPTLLERWRQAGGTLDLQRFAMAKGAFRAEGSGPVQLDDQHRPTARLQTHFKGLEPLAARFGIPVAAVKIGGLLSGLLGGKKDSDTAPGSDLNLPIVVRDGRLYLGPAKTALTVTPLY